MSSIDRRTMIRMTGAAVAAASVAPAAPASPPAAEDTAGALKAQAQALMDAVGRGDAAVWRKYLHDDCVSTSEDGEVLTKKALVDQMRPLPAGVSGEIRVIDFRAQVRGDVAVATYVSDEHETYHGHALHCQYRSTDTWVKTPGGWRLFATQVLALRTDPPPVALAPAKLDEYCGRYSLAPDVAAEIRRRGEGLEFERGGRPARGWKAEAPDVLFDPGRPRYRYVFHRDTAGKITGFAERREAWDLDWKRVP